MGGNRPYISNILDEPLCHGVIGKHPITITLCQFGDVRINFRQNFLRHLLYSLADQGLAPHNVEVMPVESKTIPHKLCECLDLLVVLGADYGVSV